MWLATRKGRRKMARRWLAALEQAEPDLAAIATRINREVSDLTQSGVAHLSILPV